MQKLRVDLGEIDPAQNSFLLMQYHCRARDIACHLPDLGGRPIYPIELPIWLARARLKSYRCTSTIVVLVLID